MGVGWVTAARKWMIPSDIMWASHQPLQGEEEWGKQEAVTSFLYFSSTTWAPQPSNPGTKLQVKGVSALEGFICALVIYAQVNLHLYFISHFVILYPP